MSLNSHTRRKRKHEDDDLAMLDELEWTAARCFRLLRSIESRIAVLRRISGAARGTSRHTATVCSKSSRTPHGPHPDGNIFEQPDQRTQHDPVWLKEERCNPSIGFKTYSNRGHAQRSSRPAAAKHSTDPKTLRFSSPLLKLFRPNDPESTSACLNSTKNDRRSNQGPKTSQRKYFKRTTEADEAERQLEMALANVLVTTQAKNQTHTRGVSTLKSLCLRRVHAHIELDNDITNACNRDSHNECTFEIYTSLEDWGCSRNTGWRGLREVIRAHSIGAVCKAIEGMLLSNSVIERLIDICSERNAVEEGQKLIRSWLLTTPHSTTRQLAILEAFSRKHECYGFSLRVWREIGSSDKTFLHTQIKKLGFEDMMLKSIMETPGLEASQILCDCIVASMGSDAPQKSESKQISSSHMEKVGATFTIIAALHTSLSGRQNGVVPLVEHIFRAVIGLHLHSLRSNATDVLTVPKYLVMAILVLSNLQSSPLPDFMPLGMEPLMEDIVRRNFKQGSDREKNIDDDELTFARNFAEAILCLENRLKIDLIGRFISNLSGTESVVTIGKTLLRKTKLELAIAASRSDFSGQNDQALMEEVSKIMSFRASEALIKTPEVKTGPRALRWEESICEWTLVTPATGVAADNFSVAGRARDEACDEENEIKDPKHTACDKTTGAAPSSPDILTGSPCFKQSGIREDGLAERRTRRFKPFRSVYTPTKIRLNGSLPRTERDESPDVITMYHDIPPGRIDAKAVPDEFCTEHSDRLVAPSGHEDNQKSQRLNRRSIQTTSTTIDDDEDEIG